MLEVKRRETGRHRRPDDSLGERRPLRRRHDGLTRRALKGGCRNFVRH